MQISHINMLRLFKYYTYIAPRMSSKDNNNSIIKYGFHYQKTLKKYIVDV